MQGVGYHPWSSSVAFLLASLLLSLVIPMSTQHAYGPSTEEETVSYAHPEVHHQEASSSARGSSSGAPALLPSLLSTLFQSGGGQGGRSMNVLSSLASFLPLLLSSRDGVSLGGAGSNLGIPELLRMVGVDSNKIGTMVINAIVYVIELVSNHFFGGSNSVDGRKLDSFPGSFFFTLFDTKRAEKFLRTITNPEYPNNIINNLKKATGNDTVCIQQLICKMSPFWWGVNRSVRDFLPLAFGKKSSSSSSPLLKLGWKSLLTKYVPSVREFTDNSDICETRYNGCVVMAFQKPSNDQQRHQQPNMH